MNSFFPQDDLERFTPEQTRILSIDVRPLADGQRVMVDIRITPFTARPYIELRMIDASGREVTAASIVEPMGWNLELTLHLRGATASPFTLEAQLYYPEGPRADLVTKSFEIAAAR